MHTDRDIHTYIQTYRQTGQHSYIQSLTYKPPYRQSEIQRNTHTYILRDIETGRGRARQNIQRYIHTDRARQTNIHTDKQTNIYTGIPYIHIHTQAGKHLHTENK